MTTMNFAPASVYFASSPASPIGTLITPSLLLASSDAGWLGMWAFQWCQNFATISFFTLTFPVTCQFGSHSGGTWNSIWIWPGYTSKMNTPPKNEGYIYIYNAQHKLEPVVPINRLYIYILCNPASPSINIYRHIVKGHVSNSDQHLRPGGMKVL